MAVPSSCRAILDWLLGARHRALGYKRVKGGIMLEEDARLESRPASGSDRPRGLYEPGARGVVDLRADHLADAGVVGVEPGLVGFGQQAHVDAVEVDGGERQGLEFEILAVGALDLGFFDRHQVLDADAKGSSLVEAGLVADDQA